MLKIGKYNDFKKTYNKRSSETLVPFIEVNPTVLANTISILIDFIGEEKITDESLEKLIRSGNFSKIYTTLLKSYKEKAILNSNKEDGKWITYKYETNEEVNEKEKEGIEPEYMKLYKDLQLYNSRWCTADNKKTSKSHISGGVDYKGGDFYVYYTKDADDNYVISRIAIRMDKDLIGEIRGIDELQNLEAGLEDVLLTKIQEIAPNDKNLEKHIKMVNDMKKLTELDKKQTENIEFNESDLRFIYEIDNEIEGFGY